MISIEEAQTWVLMAGACGACLGLFAGVALSLAARWDEREPQMPLLAGPGEPTVRRKRGAL